MLTTPALPVPGLRAPCDRVTPVEALAHSPPLVALSPCGRPRRRSPCPCVCVDRGSRLGQRVACVQRPIAFKESAHACPSRIHHPSDLSWGLNHEEAAPTRAATTPAPPPRGRPTGAAWKGGRRGLYTGGRVRERNRKRFGWLTPNRFGSGLEALSGSHGRLPRRCGPSTRSPHTDL